jgi:hypothetical protein
MPKGSITEDDREFVETWENISTSGNDIIKLDRRGDEVHELITGRRNFMITTEERLITEDRILNEADNPFRNGAFRPVTVPDSVNIESNPNALSDEEIGSILVSSQRAWDEWMTVIDSPSTLQRMIDIADQGDLDISLKRYKAVQDRLGDVKPKTQITQKDRAQYESMGRSSAPSSRGGEARTRAAAKAS